MSDNTDLQTPLVEPVVTDPVDTQTEPTEAEKELQTKLEAMELENKRIKGIQTAIDKKLLALQKEKDELAKKTMTEDEQRNAALEADRQVLVNETKSIFTESLGLTDETANLIDGKTAQEVKERSETLKAYKIAVLADKDTEIAALKKEIEVLRGEMPNPGGGKKPAGTGQMKRAEFEKLSTSAKMKAIVEDKISVID